MVSHAGWALPPERRRVGMVFQDFALFPHLRVGDNIGFGLRHLSEQERRARVRALLELVGLAGYESGYPHQLSGGQQQRIALARAIAPRPELLLADVPTGNLDAATRPPLPIVLSAKNAERLKAYARRILEHVRRHAVDLTDLAYTLQVGRDSMSERLGVLAGSSAQLVERLQAFVDGTAAEGLYQGRVRRNKEDINIISDDEDIKRSVLDKLIADHKWSKLLELWVKGLDLDWRRLYGSAHPEALQPRRISLPAYPFARERYWIDTSATGRPTPARQVDAGKGTAEKPPLSQDQR